jgi:hypothetical protein
MLDYVSGVKWNRVKRSGTEWNRVKRSGTEWNRMEPNGTEAEPNGTEDEINHSNIKWTMLDSIYGVKLAERNKLNQVTK